MDVWPGAPRYRAYLLRCWAERGAGDAAPATWRCSLEDPHTGQRQGFAGLEALVAFLSAELTAEPRAADSRDAPLGGGHPP